MNQLLESIEHVPEEGRLTLQSARYLLVQPALLVELQKALETQIPSEASSVLARVSQTDGATLGTRLKEVFSYSEEQVLSSFAFMLGESGWGATSVEMLNLESKEIVLKVVDSPFAEEYGPSVNPVCHLLLGLFEGVAMALFDIEVEGQEVQCSARGDGLCRFAVSAKRI
jgi:predicted hydrocarbon binding protein